MSEVRTASAFLRDRAQLLHAASPAGEDFERLAREAKGQTVTISRDAALELAEQFQRIAALLVIAHISEVDPMRKIA